VGSESNWCNDEDALLLWGYSETKTFDPHPDAGKKQGERRSGMLRMTESTDSTVEQDVLGASRPLDECHAVCHLFGWKGGWVDGWVDGIPAVEFLSHAYDRC
jgi:hypothetical protein